MSKIIAEAAIRGAYACVTRAETMLSKAIDRHGRSSRIAFPDHHRYKVPDLNRIQDAARAAGRSSASARAAAHPRRGTHRAAAVRCPFKLGCPPDGAPEPR